MKIYAPVDNVNGIYASVLFVNSVGETDNPALIEWFKSHGYEIVCDDNPRVVEKVEDTIEEPTPKYAESIEDMSVSELREFMKQNGINPMNIQNKEKLIERFKRIRG